MPITRLVAVLALVVAASSVVLFSGGSGPRSYDEGSAGTVVMYAPVAGRTVALNAAPGGGDADPTIAGPGAPPSPPHTPSLALALKLAANHHPGLGSSRISVPGQPLPLSTLSPISQLQNSLISRTGSPQDRHTRERIERIVSPALRSKINKAQHTSGNEAVRIIILLETLDDATIEKVRSHAVEKRKLGRIKGLAAEITLDVIPSLVEDIDSIHTIIEDLPVNIFALDEAAHDIGPLLPSTEIENPLNPSSTRIAVIDSGIDDDLAALNDLVVFQQDFTGEGTDDFIGHGTAVASVIVSVNPSIELLDLKIIDSRNRGYVSDLIAAIEYATDPDGNPLTSDSADIISLSLGLIAEDGSAAAELVNDAVRNAVSKGVTVVSAAGNFGPDRNTLVVPAHLDEVITVGSANRELDGISRLSSRGLSASGKPDILAPGIAVLTRKPVDTLIGTMVDDSHAEVSGTSMSAAYISGVASLIISDLSTDGERPVPDTVKEHLLSQGTRSADGYMIHSKNLAPASYVNVLGAPYLGEENFTVTLRASSPETSIGIVYDSQSTLEEVDYEDTIETYPENRTIIFHKPAGTTYITAALVFSFEDMYYSKENEVTFTLLDEINVPSKHKYYPHLLEREDDWDDCSSIGDNEKSWIDERLKCGCCLLQGTRHKYESGRGCYKIVSTERRAGGFGKTINTKDVPQSSYYYSTSYGGLKPRPEDGRCR